MHLLIRCVTHDKNMDFVAKRYSHIVVAACLNARQKHRLNSKFIPSPLADNGYYKGPSQTFAFTNALELLKTSKIGHNSTSNFTEDLYFRRSPNTRDNFFGAQPEMFQPSPFEKV